MSHKVNLVRVLTAATGNSTPIELGLAYSQLFMTPAEAGAMNGRVYSYLIVDGNNWEYGRGVYTSSGNTLARNVIASRIGGTLGTSRINLSGTAQVRFVELSEDMDGVRGTRAVTGTSDTLVNSDQGYVVTYNNASAIAVSLAQAGTSGLFLDGWATFVKNKGAGTVTITPATSTIEGAATLQLKQKQAALIWSDGTNYDVLMLRGDLGTPIRADAAQTLQASERAQARRNAGFMGVQSKSANYTVTADDYGALISCTANMTLAFTAAATLGDGFRVDIENAASGVASAALVTLDPNGSETINGQSTVTLAPGEKCTVVCDGAGFRTIGLSGSVVLAAGSVANVSEIVLQLPAGFKNAELKLSGISPVSAGAAFQMQVSSNGGSSWATGYERAYGGVDTSGGTASWAKANGAATFFLTSGLGVDYGGGIAIDLFDYETAALYKMFFVRATYALQSGAYDMRISSGILNTGFKINAVRISCTTGNIKSAMYQLIAHRFG